MPFSECGSMQGRFGSMVCVCVWGGVGGGLCDWQKGLRICFVVGRCGFLLFLHLCGRFVAVCLLPCSFGISLRGFFCFDCVQYRCGAFFFGSADLNACVI